MTETPKKAIKPITWRYATAEYYRKAVYQVVAFHRASDQQFRTETTETVSGSGSSVDLLPSLNSV